MKDCIADNSFQPSLTQNDMISCQKDQSLTSYDRCSLENRLHRESMTSVLNCYYDKAHVEDGSIIRLSKLETLSTRNSTPEVYSVLMNCKANNASDVISMKNCLSQNANVIFITQQQSAAADEEEVDDACSSLVSEMDLKNFKDSNRFDISIAPYLKCVQENLNIIQDGCFYIENFLEVYGGVYKELVTKCFLEGADTEQFNFIKFWGCYYN